MSTIGECHMVANIRFKPRFHIMRWLSLAACFFGIRRIGEWFLSDIKENIKRYTKVVITKGA